MPGTPTKTTEGTRSIIRQSVILPASARELYDSYLDSARHSEITGGPAEISAKAGSAFSAHGGVLTGTTLSVVDSSLIVQSWRSKNFHDTDPDSTLILSFTAKGDNSGQIDLVHLDVPEQDYDGVSKGWEAFYWGPWRAYLAGEKK